MKNLLIVSILIMASSHISAPKPPSFRVSALTVASNNQAGQKIYTSKCIACHNKDPFKAGSVGPDLKGTTLELLTLKTQKREYPKGYTPKRKTKIMPKIPLNDTQLNDLYQYIDSFNKE